MKKVLWTVFALTMGYFAFVHLSHLKKIHSFDQNILKDQVYVIEMELYPLLQNPTQNATMIKKLENELFWFELEILRKKFYFDFIMTVILSVSIIALFAQYFTNSTRKTVRSSINERTPTEKYMDEFSFSRVKMAGFASKEEAIAWLENDKLQYCEYCGGKNVPTKNAQPDQVQFCTFYKEVPKDAKDLRIVLGAMWYVVPATEVVCSKCAKIVKRV